MNIELILWIVAGILISEAIYIPWYKYICKSGDFCSTLLEGDWIPTKLFSILIAFIILAIHAKIIFSGCPDGAMFCELRHYNYLIWEGVLILGLGLLFLINKAIAKKIEGKK